MNVAGYSSGPSFSSQDFALGELPIVRRFRSERPRASCSFRCSEWMNSNLYLFIYLFNLSIYFFDAVEVFWRRQCIERFKFADLDFGDQEIGVNRRRRIEK